METTRMEKSNLSKYLVKGGETGNCSHLWSLRSWLLMKTLDGFGSVLGLTYSEDVGKGLLV